MGKCIKCGTNFVGTPENPPADGLCKYCEIDTLKSENSKLRKQLAQLVGLREKSEASLHHWQRIKEDSSSAHQRQSADITISWIRGYLRALDDLSGK